MKKLVAVANCVMCATCYALCPVVAVDPAFAGPAAIAYAYRFIEDVRDIQPQRTHGADQRRLLVAVRALLRVFVLPKHVDPQDRHHRRQARDDRRSLMMDDPGPRHALVVARTIKHTGMLQETEVIQGTVGRFNVVGLIKVAPLGLRMAMAGKIPPMFLKPVPKVNEVARFSTPWRLPILT